MGRVLLPLTIVTLMGSAIGLLEYLRPAGGLPTGMAAGMASRCTSDPERCAPTGVVLTVDGFFVQQAEDTRPPHPARRSHRRLFDGDVAESPAPRAEATEPGTSAPPDTYVGGLFAPHADVVVRYGTAPAEATAATTPPPGWDVGSFLSMGPSPWTGTSPVSWVRATATTPRADPDALRAHLLRRLATVPRLVFSCDGDSLVDGFTVDLDFVHVAAPHVQNDRCRRALPDLDVDTHFDDGAAEIRMTGPATSTSAADAYFRCAAKATDVGHRLHCTVEGIVYDG